MQDKKDTLALITISLNYILGLLGVIAFLLVIFKGAIWLHDNVYPVISFTLFSFTFITVISSIALLISRKTRDFGAFGLIISSYSLGFTLWLWSLIMAKLLAGTVWLLIGVLLAAVGVIPIALIAAALQSEWSIAINILIMGAVTLVLRFAGFAFISDLEETEDIINTKQEEKRQKAAKPTDSQMQRNYEALVKSQGMSEEEAIKMQTQVMKANRLEREKLRANEDAGANKEMMDTLAENYPDREAMQKAALKQILKMEEKKNNQ
jgi:signal transduction histidine kinase